MALLPLLFLSLFARSAFLHEPIQKPERTPVRPQVKFIEYRLSNGLRVLLCPDKSAPVVAVSVTYDVGSRNERPGRTGFAHLFEHMMFQGSENVGKGEHMMLIQDNGGTLNGTTNSDRTNYFETLPANQLDLGLFLECDRMRSLDISQQNLDNQRAVVQEERRQSYDNQAYGQSREAMSDMLYSNFAYKHSTIGSMADLNAATLSDVREFFKTYYAPNNAALAVVGDFDVEKTKAKIEKYFGAIPRQAAPPPVDLTEPTASGERRRNMTDPLARLTRYDAAYLTVPGNDPDAPALTILGSILSHGRTGRLYSAVVEKRLALNVQAGGIPGRGPGMFNFSAMIPGGVKPEEMEKAIDSEVAKIQQSGVTEDEIKKAKIQAKAAELIGGGFRGGGGLQTALGRANALTQNAIYYNDPNRINTWIEKLQAVTAEDVKRVAQKYLQKSNRAVIITSPEREDGYGPDLNVVGGKEGGR
jgi:predicted Zn-dependent peptidase